LGYQHLSLQSDKVKRTRNETADPLNLQFAHVKRVTAAAAATC
jgi:hypothetical protein